MYERNYLICCVVITKTHLHKGYISITLRAFWLQPNVTLVSVELFTCNLHLE